MGHTKLDELLNNCAQFKALRGTKNATKIVWTVADKLSDAFPSLVARCRKAEERIFVAESNARIRGDRIAGYESQVVTLEAKLARAETVVRAADSLTQELGALENDQSEKLGHGLESACDNWNVTKKTLDFGPLIKALAACKE